jgi:hypothetical protein
LDFVREKEDLRVFPNLAEDIGGSIKKPISKKKAQAPSGIRIFPAISPSLLFEDIPPLGWAASRPFSGAGIGMTLEMRQGKE